MRIQLVLLAIALATLSADAQRSDARGREADSLRVLIDNAAVRDDRAALQAAARLADRLVTLAPNDGGLAYDRGYVLFRLAIIASRGTDRAAYRDLLSDADHALETASASLPLLAEAHALRASVLGQLIGLNRNPFVAMRLGPRSGKEMKRALELGPANPRVWLLRGINTMHTPRLWGGSLSAAEEYLRKAQTLFAADTAHPPDPTWGKVDVEIALGQLHLMQHRRDDARADFGRALMLQSENAWVRDTLMREAASDGSSRSSP